MKSYEIEFNKITSPKLEDVISLSSKYVPIEYANQPWACLASGIPPITYKYKLYCYMKAYGYMHKAKFDYAFKFLSKKFLESHEIDIVDYGCGQAMGVMCYSDYLEFVEGKQRIHSITLIEPSKLALDRAELHARKFFPGAKIITINKKLNDLTFGDIANYSRTTKLHIFSNVLDIDTIDIAEVSSLIKKSFGGYSQFISVGPSRGGCSYSDSRLTEFTKSFNVRDAILRYKGYGFRPGKIGTCACGVFGTYLNENKALRA
jgi:hypothetical protein